MTDGPLIVQSDHTLLLEIDHPQAQECRREIAVFAELERSPEHVHTYRLTKLGLWNARAAGHDAEAIVDTLVRFSRFPVSPALLLDVTDTVSRYGRLELHNHPAHGLVLVSHDRAVLTEVQRHKKTAGMLGAPCGQGGGLCCCWPWCRARHAPTPRLTPRHRTRWPRCQRGWS